MPRIFDLFWYLAGALPPRRDMPLSQNQGRQWRLAHWRILLMTRRAHEAYARRDFIFIAAAKMQPHQNDIYL